LALRARRRGATNHVCPAFTRGASGMTIPDRRSQRFLIRRNARRFTPIRPSVAAVQLASSLCPSGGRGPGSAVCVEGSALKPAFRGLERSGPAEWHWASVKVRTSGGGLAPTSAHGRDFWIEKRPGRHVEIWGPLPGPAMFSCHRRRGSVTPGRGLAFPGGRGSFGGGGLFARAASAFGSSTTTANPRRLSCPMAPHLRTGRRSGGGQSSVGPSSAPELSTTLWIRFKKKRFR